MFGRSEEIKQVKEYQYKVKQLSGVLTTGVPELLWLRPWLTNRQKQKTGKLSAILKSSYKENGQQLKFPLLCQDAYTAAREFGPVAERMEHVNSNESRERLNRIKYVTNYGYCARRYLL